ncbi:nucleoside triphosphate pyrophosphohydrolase [Ruminococcaceae bacterium OttesenSCG-928-L11]|nr:nucleoside triphosphate pyrophosphohydrolase [Ruminococcaceae bacterium OttesenSCG-928-L11]
MTIPYNKLVRDFIPQIIEESGKSALTRTLNDDEYLDKLEEKLQEEVAEYLESGSPEELCDILEVVEALFAARKVPMQLALSIKDAKRKKHGAFEERVLLMEVSDSME